MAEFCFDYPADWSALGRSFGIGVVVAPPQTGDPSLWNEVTLAVVALPADEDQPAKTIDELIDIAMQNMRADGRDPVTMQRRQLSVAGLPAETIRVRYQDAPTSRDWIEELVFIEGSDQEVYSLALKATPDAMAGLEPAFQRIVQSWKLQTRGGSSASSSAPSTAKPSEAPTPAPHY